MATYSMYCTVRKSVDFHSKKEKEKKRERKARTKAVNDIRKQKKFSVIIYFLMISYYSRGIYLSICLLYSTYAYSHALSSLPPFFFFSRFVLFFTPL